ncbi:MAG: hypothetical protein FRX49_04145 [Trebouxia sp. A1-2]|nr:MAG: hypothetical protein FRX49_04145 [Trebouxia sp. A1-2]
MEAREAQSLRALVKLRQLQGEGWQRALTPQLTAEAAGSSISTRLYHCLKGSKVGADSIGNKVDCHEARLIGWDDKLSRLGCHREGVGGLWSSGLDAEVHCGLHLLGTHNHFSARHAPHPT